MLPCAGGGLRVVVSGHRLLSTCRPPCPYPRRPAGHLCPVPGLPGSSTPARPLSQLAPSGYSPVTFPGGPTVSLRALDAPPQRWARRGCSRAGDGRARNSRHPPGKVTTVQRSEPARETVLLSREPELRWSVSRYPAGTVGTPAQCVLARKSSGTWRPPVTCLL